ncbi:ABC transporter ATP-binding protein [Actinomadura sp. KC06]|uniref:ABC transporter ATP-binding protein n=1 Tax=Actinomadura sp. KC06 TaxID=2530369 RepID=UPI0014052CAD|nr:ABC transporter ATP-binding protein [Actinomadura sp. KC06]
MNDQGGTATPAITTERLSKRYPATGTALAEVSVTVPSGSRTALLGPQRSGKTTLLNLLAGLAAPTSGSFRVTGRIRGIVHPYGFYPWLTGRQNLTMLCRLAGTDAAEADGCLERLRIETVADQRYGTYSLGTKQRLAIAASLLGDPAVLLLDEPSNGLDQAGADLLEEILAERAGQGTTILMTTHHLRDAERGCDHAILLDAGACVYQGTMGGLLARGAEATGDRLERVFLRLTEESTQ